MIRRLFLALAFCALASAAHATCTNSTNPIVPGMPGAPFTCDTGSTPRSGDIVQGGAVATGSTVGWTWGQIFSTFGTGTTPGGNPQTVQFNNFTAFGGDPTFTFNPTTKAVGASSLLLSGTGTALTLPTGSNASIGGTLSIGGLTTITGGVLVPGGGGGVIQGPMLYAEAGGVNGGTYTYSGTQGATQYGLRSDFNLAGAITSGFVYANQNLINADTVNLSSGSPQGVYWAQVAGNVGLNPWTPSTVIGTNLQRSSGGSIYSATAGGTTAAVASFTGAISGTALTVSGVTGTIAVGQLISQGAMLGTYIVSGSGTSWVVSPSQTVGSASMVSGGPGGTGLTITDGTVTWKYVSPEFSGSRSALSLVQDTRSSNDPAITSDLKRQWPTLIITSAISANQGGTAPMPGLSAGFTYSLGLQSQCFAGATNLSGCTGQEIDVGLFGAAGGLPAASANHRIGLNIVSFGVGQGVNLDIAYMATEVTGATGWRVGWGIWANWSLDTTNGAIWQFIPNIPGAGAGAAYQNPVSPFGFDISGLELGIPLRVTGGSSFDASGDLLVQSAELSTSGAVVTLDTSGNELASVAIADGGSGCLVGDHLFDRGTGSVIGISTVNGTGQATLLSIVQKGHYNSSAPSNPVTLLGGSCGTAVTVNMSWTAGTTLALGPTAATAINIGNSGSTTNVAGAIQAGGTAGVTCAAGVPSSSFTTKNGIVTHC